MRRLSAAILTAGLSLGVGHAAFAADMPMKAPVHAPTPAVYNWTGWYVGVNAGYAFGRSQATTAVPAFGPPGLTPPEAAFLSGLASPTFNENGFTGGLQIGYNMQSGNIVYGLESDFGAFNLHGSITQNGAIGALGVSSATDVKTDWLFTLRPRLGLAVNNWLLYATGGLAVTDIRYSQFNAIALFGPEQASFTHVDAGWTVGGGAEAMIDKNWSIKGEYLYTSFGTVSSTAFHPLDPVAAFNHSIKLTSHVVRLGLNYRFGL